VGLRVADKREAEYHSGKRLQYQGACYLFRIDTEQIIDATRKGGIARFVNHSCSVKSFSHAQSYQVSFAYSNWSSWGVQTLKHTYCSSEPRTNQ